MTNYFELLGITPSVDIEIPVLEAKYRELSLRFHPDRQDSTDFKARRIAIENTSLLNEALKTLRDPVRRYSYILRLNGVDLDSADSITQRSLPIAFLEEVMEKRNQLEEARDTSDLPRAEKLADEAKLEYQRTLAQARELLKIVLVDPKKPALENAAAVLDRVRYYVRLVEEVEMMKEKTFT